MLLLDHVYRKNLLFHFFYTACHSRSLHDQWSNKSLRGGKNLGPHWHDIITYHHHENWLFQFRLWGQKRKKKHFPSFQVNFLINVSFIIGKLDYMINKYWVIYGLKLCLLIYYRNELFNWYQIEPNEVDSCLQELVVYWNIHLRELNEIEFYLFYIERFDDFVFVVGLHIFILFFNSINIDFSRRWKKFRHAETDRRWYNEFIRLICFFIKIFIGFVCNFIYYVYKYSVDCML